MLTSKRVAGKKPWAPWINLISPLAVQAFHLEVSLLNINLALPSRVGTRGPQPHRLRPEPLIPQQGISEQISGLSASVTHLNNGSNGIILSSPQSLSKSSPSTSYAPGTVLGPGVSNTKPRILMEAGNT